MLAGPIPDELGRLATLELLDLSNNRLTGGVPAALSGMTAIREMYLSGNRRLGGRVPADIFAGLKRISAVGLSDAGLTGPIPASLGESLHNVTYLGLDGNQLEGEVPPELGKLAGRVRLHGNLAICVPPEFVAAAGSHSHIAAAGVPSCKGTKIPVTRRPVVLPVPSLGIGGSGERGEVGGVADGDQLLCGRDNVLAGAGLVAPVWLARVFSLVLQLRFC
uniref:Leucine-rich repeat-containing N-terminal plant-type domain-containing protein n=1 Tax=Oryza brachyantha TaxID=4533 RepID=J3MG07_ORYBR